MLRDKNLVPLSHQHQHALALCVRIDRGVEAGKTNPEPWRAEIQALYQQEIAIHFAAEETVLFPAASRFSEMQPLVNELISEHAALRGFFAEVGERTLDAQAIRDLATLLSQHIRKEERQLFESMQRLIGPDELANIGASLNKALAGSADTCIVPSEVTKLRPRS